MVMAALNYPKQTREGTSCHAFRAKNCQDTTITTNACVKVPCGIIIVKDF